MDWPIAPDRRGPLHGTRVLEVGGIGPLPHAGMLLADLGASVIRIERHDPPPALERDDVLRSRAAVIDLDLKSPDGLQVLLDLAREADVLLEGFRPGVAERLGFGPDVCVATNPRLVFARMTGWGQQGALAKRAGHDINYISITGALHAISNHGDAPVVPLNLVGDFGGGSMLLVMGVLAALLERGTSDKGQVIDVAMVDGVSLLLQSLFVLRSQGVWNDEPGTNVIDTGAPFYDTYRCADGRHVAVGALEPRFYAELLAGLGLAHASLPNQYDRTGWPQLRRVFTEQFSRRTRDEWASVFRDRDACVTPVLAWAEVPEHEHLKSRSTHIDIDGVVQAAPAPRFSRTPLAPPRPPRS